MTPHGTRNTYAYYRCRCGPCTEANRVHGADMRADLYDREPPAHGTTAVYRNWGCRCDLCKQAQAASVREYREFYKRRKATS